MRQYLDLCNRVISEGVWVENKRTGQRCLTVINADFEYDCSEGLLPILTTKKSYWKQAIAEMLGYLRGYDSASQFRELGCNTWNSNANENSAWLKNPNRKGVDDMGYCYGAVARNFRMLSGGYFDQVCRVYTNLKNGIDDRGEIITFMHPSTEYLSCLRACMHTHTFSILDNTLYLTSYQRSADLPLGLPFNMIQVAWLLMVMAQITGLKAGTAYHKIVNAHIYENQLQTLKEKQSHLAPYPSPTLHINPKIKTLEDLETWVTLDNFWLEGYQHHPAIKYEFSV